MKNQGFRFLTKYIDSILNKPLSLLHLYKDPIINQQCLRHTKNVRIFFLKELAQCPSGTVQKFFICSTNIKELEEHMCKEGIPNKHYLIAFKISLMFLNDFLKIIVV